MSVARHVRLAAPLAAWLLVASPVWSAPKAPAKPANKAPTKAERAQARDAYDKGTAAFEKGDYAAALDGFTKANSIIPSVQAAYWIAQAHDRLGHGELAIKAYEDIQARDDFSKLSPDKQATVRERLIALKSPPPPPPPAPVVEEPPPAPPPEPVAVTPEPPPPPPVSEPPPVEITPAKLLPKANTVELGILAGALLVTDSNNLVEAGERHADFEQPVWQVGARAAYFPAKFLGVEAEWAHGFGQTQRPDAPTEVQTTPAPSISRSAQLDAIRGHLIGQLPNSQFVPFALLGAGVLHADSDITGSDTDVLFEAGIGAKVIATKVLVPRLDVRLNMTQKQGGGFSDGVSVHPEILLGLGFRLGG